MRTRRTRAAALLLAATLLGGCAALRVESPPPPTPTGDEVEQARQRQALATEALLEAVASVPASEDAVDAQLAAVSDAARVQLDELGGVWVPFPSQSPSESPTTTVSPTVLAAEDVVALLVDQADGARADALATTDGRLARLVGSIALQRDLAARELARLLADEPDAAEPTPGLQSTTPAGTIPAGLSADALAPAIVSEDALGLVWEVLAARSDGEARSTAVALADAHRSRAEGWARAAGVAGGEDDPREPSYRLPDAVADPDAEEQDRVAALGALESDLTAVWLDLLGRASTGARTDLFDAAASAASTAAWLTGTVPDLPGLPD